MRKRTIIDPAARSARPSTNSRRRLLCRQTSAWRTRKHPDVLRHSDIQRYAQKAAAIIYSGLLSKRGDFQFCVLGVRAVSSLAFMAVFSLWVGLGASFYFNIWKHFDDYGTERNFIHSKRKGKKPTHPLGQMRKRQVGMFGVVIVFFNHSVLYRFFCFLFLISHIPRAQNQLNHPNHFHLRKGSPCSVCYFGHVGFPA